MAPLAMMGPVGAACGTPVAGSSVIASTELGTRAERASAGTATVCDWVTETTPSERGALPAGMIHNSGTLPCASGVPGTGTTSTVPRAGSTEASQPGLPSSCASVVTG